MRFCKGITQDGKPCKNPVKKGEDFCFQHIYQARRKRKSGLPRVITWSAPIAVLTLVLGYLADVTGVLGFFGISIPLFHVNSLAHQASGNSISIGRDMKNSTILQSNGDITVNQNPKPLATAVRGFFSPSPLPNRSERNQVFLPVVWNNP